jgi:hypothetical protein
VDWTVVRPKAFRRSGDASDIGRIVRGRAPAFREAVSFSAKAKDKQFAGLYRANVMDIFAYLGTIVQSECEWC